MATAGGVRNLSHISPPVDLCPYSARGDRQQPRAADSPLTHSFAANALRLVLRAFAAKECVSQQERVYPEITQFVVLGRRPDVASPETGTANVRKIANLIRLRGGLRRGPSARRFGPSRRPRVAMEVNPAPLLSCTSSLQIPRPR